MNSSEFRVQSSEWEIVKLGEVFSKQITGEWGTELEEGSIGTPVLRTTNFTNLGKINYCNIAIRKIDEKKIVTKKLNFGDIIVEKSGGTETTPVGRVVFCDKEISTQSYLCNNFTQAMRPNLDMVIPKYIFYFMFDLHRKGFTDLMQNKTTGIRNLQIKQYLNIELPLPPLETQKKIADELDKITGLIEKRKSQIEKLDLLTKAKFVEMFEHNKFEYVYTQDVCEFITKGTTPKSNEIFEEFTKGRIPYLKVYNLSFNGELLFDEKPQYIDSKTHENVLKRSKVFKNDVLMNIVGPPLGKFAFMTDDAQEYNINQAIAIFRAKEMLNPKYLLFALMQPITLRPFIESAVGVRQQNLSLLQCRELQIPLPPLDLQNKFAQYIEKIEKTRYNMEKGLEQLEVLYKERMQEYFG